MNCSACSAASVWDATSPISLSVALVKSVACCSARGCCVVALDGCCQAADCAGSGAVQGCHGRIDLPNEVCYSAVDITAYCLK